jgi:AraC-like DNA-binding protein
MSNSAKTDTDNDKKYIVSPFYARFKARLSSYFKNPDHLEQAAQARSPKDGAFLKQVNEEILAHLQEESFDNQALSRAMALSRSQLYRRIYALSNLPPSRYIRFVRLLKAKEIMEVERVTVSEAAFRTGFVNLSHFTRVFRQQFGFAPSEFKRLCQKKTPTP